MEEETSDLRADWETHPYTLQWAKTFEKKSDASLKQLLSDCSKSDDAVVRAAYEKYVETAVIAKWLAKGGEKK